VLREGTSFHALLLLGGRVANAPEKAW